jgi:hypothetical protein
LRRRVRNLSKKEKKEEGGRKTRIVPVFLELDSKSVSEENFKPEENFCHSIL